MRSSHWQTIKTLGIYLWPQGRRDLKVRFVFAAFFLILAKILNVYVPFLLKMSIDRLSEPQIYMLAPVGLILAYGLARILVQFFGEMRDLVFIRVGQHAQLIIALNTFKHLHELSLDFHLSRQTGGLSRVIERGTRGIQFVLQFMTFNILPTLFEIFLVTGNSAIEVTSPGAANRASVDSRERAHATHADAGAAARDRRFADDAIAEGRDSGLRAASEEVADTRDASLADAVADAVEALFALAVDAELSVAADSGANG